MATSENLSWKWQILAIVVLFTFSSCTEKAAPATTVPPPGSILVTVVDNSELDGCTFLLVLADGQKLQPINLQEEFKKKDLKLYITFKYHDGMSTCMAGRMVHLTSTTIVKEDKR